MEVSQFQGEVWSLFAVATCFTFLRMYARIKSVGVKNFQADDYLACVALVSYAAQTAIAHVGGSIYHSFASKGQLPQGIETVTTTGASKEDIRVTGAKLHFAGWPVYATTLWTLKTSLLVLYLRLTTGLSGTYRPRILFGFGFILVSWVAFILTVFLTCRPFGRMFQSFPPPGNTCSPAVSRPIVWTCYAMNVSTDLYLISIPVPMLWRSSMITWKKIGLGILFSGGMIIIIFATVRCVLITTDPKNGPPLSGTWGVREAFVAVITTNFPMAFTLIRGWLGPAFKSIRSTRHTDQEDAYKMADTIGGNGSNDNNSGGRKIMRPTKGANPTATNMIFSESEERIVRGLDTPPESAAATLRNSDPWSGHLGEGKARGDDRDDVDEGSRKPDAARWSSNKS